MSLRFVVVSDSLRGMPLWFSFGVGPREGLPTIYSGVFLVYGSLQHRIDLDVPALDCGSVSCCSPCQ